MALTLRILLVLGSLISFISVIKRIRRSKLQIEDACFWVIFSLVLMLLAIFPQIIYFLSDLTGIQSPANLLYLIIIAILILKIFAMSIQISNLESKLKTLLQNEVLESIKRD